MCWKERNTLEGEESVHEIEKGRPHKNLRSSHPRKVWKIVSKATGVPHKCIPIGMVDMAAHFQVLITQTLIHLHTDTRSPAFTNDEFLDEDIFEEEVFCDITNLK